MKVLKIGSEYRLGLSKQFCQEMNINIGDSYEVIVDDNGVITLKPLKIVSEKHTIEHTNKESEKTKTVKKEVFISNLEEGEKFSRKCYSDCGLIIRTKKKYLEQYCDRCRGQLLDNYSNGCYSCKYKCDNKGGIDEVINTTSDVKITTNENKNVINDNIPKVIKVNPEVVKVENKTEINLKDVIRKEDKEAAKQSNKFIVESINKHIEDLLKSLKKEIKDEFRDEVKSEKAINNNNNNNNNNNKSRTIIEPVAYNHYHVCDFCQENYSSGFIINNDMFLCKTCAKEDFIKYLKEIKKGVSNV